MPFNCHASCDVTMIEMLYCCGAKNHCDTIISPNHQLHMTIIIHTITIGQSELIKGVETPIAKEPPGLVDELPR